MIHPLDLHRAKQGYRFCTSCRKPEIREDEPEWKTVCANCYHSHKLLTHDQMYAQAYCTDCSGEIEKDVLESSRKVGRKIRECQSCYRERIEGKPSSKRSLLLQSIPDA